MDPNVPAPDLKRKRSPSSTTASASDPPVAKAAKTTNQLSINYLARQSHEDLPLITKEDALPNLLNLLSAYSNILDRHESLASNLGARPLGPILIKRFERCFDAPPKVVASHQKSNATSTSDDSSHGITWLEVIEFARSHPGQFTLTTFSEGKRVCQFYYPQKQLRVQISEEDFLFINSGRCQELIPPLPIWEDEEKEVGTCDVLEAKLKELTNAADMVAARTRQLSHRLKGRRAAILERRAEGGSGTPAKASALQTTTAPPSSSGANFVAVNTSNGRVGGDLPEPIIGSSATIRNDLLRHFESLPHNQDQGRPQARAHSVAGAGDISRADLSIAPYEGASNTSSLSPVPVNVLAHETLPYGAPDCAVPRPQSNSYGHRPSSSVGGGNQYSSNLAPLKHNFSRPLPPALESSQPFRPLCQAHMDSLPRGHRVLPPCDRCRRLRMDCVKNLTSCAGCTRKHARCHWREVSRDEVGALDHLMDAAYPGSSALELGLNGYLNGNSEHGDYPIDDSDEDDSNPLEDLEALGQKEEQDREDEEGLRNARELARQGWEDSIRAAHSSGADLETGQTNGAGDHPVQLDDGPGQVEQQHREGSGDSEGSGHSQMVAAKKQTYDPVHDHSPILSQQDVTTDVDESRGFRAVNQQLS